MLRIITWNCNMAFRKKAKLIEAFQPDLIVIPECEHPDKFKTQADCPLPPHAFWYGSNPHKGLGLFSYTNFRIRLLPFHNENYRLILPLEISNGVNTYQVYAIWANHPADAAYQYVGQIWKAINHYQDQIGMENTLWLGDFNSNSIWDKPKWGFDHTRIVSQLYTKGIESVYHRFFTQSQGQEAHPTYYQFRHRKKSYHIDYCFASQDLMTRLNKVEIGAYEYWSTYSDHMPLIVDFD